MTATRPGKTTRMLDYAIGAARQGREIAIIANNEASRRRIHDKLLEMASKAGCRWVVGGGINGGSGGNIEVYHVTHTMVMEQAPGDYQIRGSQRNQGREVLVDHEVLEDRFSTAIDQYIRWI